MLSSIYTRSRGSRVIYTEPCHVLGVAFDNILKFSKALVYIKDDNSNYLTVLNKTQGIIRASLVAQTVKIYLQYRIFGIDPRSGRSPAEENSYSLQYSCLANSTDRGAWWATVYVVTNSPTFLNDFHFQFRSQSLIIATYLANSLSLPSSAAKV